MKRFIIVLVVFAMFVSNINLIYGQTDQPSSWAEEAILFMKSEGAVPDKLFNDYKKEITRSEFASLIVKVIESKLNTTLPYTSNVFLDTNAVDINKAYKIQIINGIGNQKFNPDGLIKREEIAIMFVNTLKALDELESSNEHMVHTTFKPYFKDASLISSWALSSVQAAYNNGIISGVGNDQFNPKGSATREQAITIAYNVWSNLVDEDHIPNLKIKFSGKLINEKTTKTEIDIINNDYASESIDSALSERFDYNGRYYPKAYWMGTSESDAKKNFIAMYTLAMKKESDQWFVYADQAYFKTINKEVFKDTEMEYLTAISENDNFIYTGLRQDLLSKYVLDIVGPLYGGTQSPERCDDATDYKSTVAYRAYLDDIRKDEFIYTAITQDILKKYPIMFKGTLEQKKQRQLDQILELNRWFVFRTDYGNSLKYAVLTDDRYSMGILSFNPQMPYSSLYPYGTLPIDKVFSEKDRTEPAKKYLDYDVTTNSNDFKKYYFENHILETENAIKLAEYFRTSDSKFVGVCSGYSELFKAVANQMGIDTEEVGTPNNHSWNIVRLADGSIMHVDETQADQGFQSLYTMGEYLASDFRVGPLIRDGRYTSVGVSQERLKALLGSNGFGLSDTVPAGDAVAVFGTQEAHDIFIKAFRIDKGDWH